MRKYLIIILILSPFLGMSQGSFEPNADTQGNTAFHKDSSVFMSWATNCVTQRGPQDIAVSGSPIVTAGDDFMATDKSGVNGVVSLGDGGSATLTFAQPIYDGPGYDFAVFENSFSNDFLELAFVEVSSDGVNFFRFAAVSEVQTATQVDAFGLTDPSEINNLAGKYRAQFGTPFDLNELSGVLGLDIQNITHVRIIDVIGSVEEAFATYDAMGNRINDPYPTDFASGGFDLDAVGVINQKPLAIEVYDRSFQVFPNPASDFVQIFKEGHFLVNIYSASGKLVFTSFIDNNKVLELSTLSKGVYFIQIESHIQKLIIN